jgi:FtsP/CotA-like multicopper oxidase with cupredoxin domain
LHLDRRVFLGTVAAALFELPPWPARSQSTARSASTPKLTLEAQEGSLQLASAPAPPTRIWAFNGAIPGPLLRVKQGDEIRVRLVNRLAAPTTLHWHGVRLVNAMDGAGGLTQPGVPPGGSFDYRFVAPDAGTYWYRPEVGPPTAEQIGRGLYGALIVNEPHPPAADRDFLLVLQDWRLDSEKQIAAKTVGATPASRLVTANSQLLPATLTAAPASRLRLRILNVASRVMPIALVDAKPTVVAIDGQPSEPFEPAHDGFPIGPGARFDLILDLPPNMGAASKLVIRDRNAPEVDLLLIGAAGKAASVRNEPAQLPPNAALPSVIALERAKRLDIACTLPTDASSSGQSAPIWSVNRKPLGDFSQPCLAVRRGTPIVIGLANRSRAVLSVHVHGHAMRLLHDLDDGWEPYWRDGVIVEPGKTHHVAFLADNPGKWLIACSLLGDEGADWRTWFAVA